MDKSDEGVVEWLKNLAEAEDLKIALRPSNFGIYFQILYKDVVIVEYGSQLEPRYQWM